MLLVRTDKYAFTSVGLLWRRRPELRRCFQDYSYSPEIRILNHFEITATVPVAPDSLILAQKLSAILSRNRVMTRDLCDAVYLFGRTEPDMEYLLRKQGTDDRRELDKRIKRKLSDRDIEQLASEYTS